jgi:hypothetical protein
MAQLTSLNLGENKIGAAGAASLAPSLALMAKLTSLDLYYNEIGDAGAASLAPALAAMMRLESLGLGANALGPGGVASLAPALSQMTKLVSLDLRGNNLRAAGAASIAPALSRMPDLTSLHLQDNHLGAAGAESLTPALAKMTQLTSLALKNNSIGTAGMTSLAPALSRMTKLRSLGLEHHYVRDYIEAAADLQPRPVSLAHLRSALPLNLRVRGEDGESIHFMINRTTPMKRLMDAYCARRNNDPDLTGFLFDGNLISPSNTALELEMKHVDEIDAMRLCGPSTAERTAALAAERAARIAQIGILGFFD